MVVFAVDPAHHQAAEAADEMELYIKSGLVKV